VSVLVCVFVYVCACVYVSLSFCVCVCVCVWVGGRECGCVVGPGLKRCCESENVSNLLRRDYFCLIILLGWTSAKNLLQKRKEYRSLEYLN